MYKIRKFVNHIKKVYDIYTNLGYKSTKLHIYKYQYIIHYNIHSYNIYSYVSICYKNQYLMIKNILIIKYRNSIYYTYRDTSLNIQKRNHDFTITDNEYCYNKYQN